MLAVVVLVVHVRGQMLRSTLLLQLVLLRVVVSVLLQLLALFSARKPSKCDRRHLPSSSNNLFRSSRASPGY